MHCSKLFEVIIPWFQGVHTMLGWDKRVVGLWLQRSPFVWLLLPEYLSPTLWPTEKTIQLKKYSIKVCTRWFLGYDYEALGHDAVEIKEMGLRKQNTKDTTATLVPLLPEKSGKIQVVFSEWKGCKAFPMPCTVLDYHSCRLASFLNGRSHILFDLSYRSIYLMRLFWSLEPVLFTVAASLPGAS